MDGKENENGVVQLVISLLPGGQINVNGPVGNKILCYGMLDLAKDAIRDYVGKSPLILVPEIKFPNHPN
jgi:hypothetical protein